jgi:hypothetical protein
MVQRRCIQERTQQGLQCWLEQASRTRISVHGVRGIHDIQQMCFGLCGVLQERTGAQLILGGPILDRFCSGPPNFAIGPSYRSAVMSLQNELTETQTYNPTMKGA